MKPSFEDASVRLDDYVRGQGNEQDADAYEADLFARALAVEAPELSFRDQLERSLREMKAHGVLSPWLTERGAQELLSSGIRVRQAELDPTSPKPPDLSGDFDILLTRVPVALAGIRRIDAELMTPTGKTIKVMPEIDFEPSENAVYLCCERELAVIASHAKVVTRVWAHDDRGERKVLFEMTYAT